MSKYTLVEKQAKEVNRFKVTIKADSNDADYITNVSFYSKRDFEDYVIDGLIDLQKNGSGHYELENYNNKYDLDIPWNGWDGQCHTLEELIVEYIDENGKLWAVQF